MKCEFIFDFDTDAALKRIEKKQKMRRTGQNPRRTGQRGGNGGENESGFLDRIFRICRIYSKIYEVLEVTQIIECLSNCK